MLSDNLTACQRTQRRFLCGWKLIVYFRINSLPVLYLRVIFFIFFKKADVAFTLNTAEPIRTQYEVLAEGGRQAMHPFELSSCILFARLRSSVCVPPTKLTITGHSSQIKDNQPRYKMSF